MRPRATAQTSRSEELDVCKRRATASGSAVCDPPLTLVSVSLLSSMDEPPPAVVLVLSPAAVAATGPLALASKECTRDLPCALMSPSALAVVVCPRARC